MARSSNRRPTVRPFRFMLFLALAGLGACGGPDRELKEAVTERDVLGLWVVSLDTQEILRRDGFVPDPMNPLYVTLHPKGKCGFLSIEMDSGKPKAVLDDCTWRLEHDTKLGSNPRRKNSIHLLSRKNTGSGTLRVLWLGKVDDRLFLWEQYGNPKNEEYIDYVRNFEKSS